MFTSELWGEMPSFGPAITLGPSEKEALCRLPRPLQLKGPKLHQPGSGATRPPGVVREEEETGRSESVLLRCAKLQEALRTQDGGGNSARQLSLSPILLQRAGPFDTEYFIEEEEVVKSENTTKRGRKRVPPSHLGSTSAKAGLRRSTAEVLSAVGFSTSSDLALDVAADAAEEVLRRFCLRLRDAKESGGGGGKGFADCLERALAEAGEIIMPWHLRGLE